MCKTRAPAREPRKKQDLKSFALACAFLRPPVWPSVSCVGGSVFRCGFVVPVCFSALVALWFLLCRSFLPFVSRAPTQKPSTLEGNLPSTYAVTEYAATYIGGNAGLPIVLCTVQFLSAFSPSSILASAYCAFHRPSRERKRYYSLWSSVFPVPPARRGITSYSRLSPNARRHNSSRQPHHVVYLAMAVAAAVHDRRCGLSSRRQPCVELFVTGTHFVRVHRVMFWTSASLRPTAKTLRRHAM